MGVLLGDGAQDVEADDVLRAFPDRVALGVTELTGQGPVLDVAVAAQDLQPLAGHLQAAAGGAKLGERHEYAVEAPRLLVAGAISQGGGLEDDGGGGLDLHGHLHQRLLHHRQLVQAAAEGLAVGGVDCRLQEAAPGDAQPHGGDAQPRAVDHAHHAVEPPRLRRPALGVAEDVGLGVHEVDLGGGDGAGAQLVLDALDVDAVGGAVSAGGGDDEEGEAASAGAGALGPGQGSDGFSVNVGAEPLGAVQQPGPLILLTGRRLSGAEV